MLTSAVRERGELPVRPARRDYPRMREIYLCVNEQRQSALPRHAGAAQARECVGIFALLSVRQPTYGNRRPGCALGYHDGRLSAGFAPAMAARNRSSLSRNSISACLRLVMSTPVPQYPVKAPASSYIGSPLME